VNKTEQKFKDWLMSKIPHPEVLNTNDHKMLDFFIGFFISTLPQFVGMMALFSLLSYMYLWGLKKYGLERTLIVLMVNIVISIGQVGKAVGNLSKN